MNFYLLLTWTAVNLSLTVGEDLLRQIPDRLHNAADEDGDYSVSVFPSTPVQNETVKEHLRKNESNWGNLTHSGSSLHPAAAFNDSSEEAEAILNEFLNSSALISGTNGQFAIHIAAARNSTRELDLILKKQPGLLEQRNILNRYTPLCTAAEVGALEATKLLVEKGANLDARILSGATAIHLAALNGQPSVVSYLLSVDANLTNITDNAGITPIVYAVTKGHSEIAELFLDHGADLETKNEDRTIFYEASKLGWLECVRLLYERGANFTAVAEDMQPIHIAANKGRVAVVDFLLTREPQLINATDSSGNFPIYSYFDGFNQNGEPMMLEVFLKHGTDVNNTKPIGQNNMTLLHVLAAIGSLTLFKKLVELGANYKALAFESDSMPMFFAAAYGNIAIVDYLVKLDPSQVYFTNRNGLTPIKIAVIKGQVAVVDYLLKNGDKIENYDNGTVPLIHHAAASGTLSMVRFLLARGANITSVDKAGMIPLHHAAFGNNTAIVKFFVDNGVKIDVRDNLGFTPFQYACMWKNVEIARFLIEKGVDLAPDSLSDRIVEYDDIGPTNRVEIWLPLMSWLPIHFAAFFGSADIVEAILNVQPRQVNLPNNKGLLPIHIAVFNGQIEVVAFFIDRLNVSIETRTRDMYGLTCLQRAAFSNELEMVRYLISRGANISAVSWHGHLAIHYAARIGFTAIVDYLLSVKPDLIAVNTSRLLRPIHLAATSDNSETIELLLKRGEYVDVIAESTELRMTPFDFALRFDQFENAKYLVSKGANYSNPFVSDDENGTWTPIQYASMKGYLPFVRYFVSLDSSLLYQYDDDGKLPIHYAALYGQVAVVDYFLKQNMSVNVPTRYFGFTPLHYGCGTQSLSTFRFLVSKGANLMSSANVDVFNQQPIHFAAKIGALSALKYLLGVDRSLNRTTEGRGLFPVHLAAERGELEVVAYFLNELGVDINIRQSGGARKTMLHLSAARGSLMLVDYLMGNLANMTIKSSAKNDEMLPIHLASLYGHKKVVELFLQYKPNLVNATDKRGNRPIDKAAQNGRIGVVLFLGPLSGGFNKRNAKSGRTLLFQAASNGHLGLVKALIKNGADINLASFINGNLQTPLDGAINRGWTNTINDLIQLGGKSARSINAPDEV